MSDTITPQKPRNTPQKAQTPPQERPKPEKKWLSDLDSLERRNEQRMFHGVRSNPLNWRPVVLARFLARPPAAHPAKMSWARKMN